MTVMWKTSFFKDVVILCVGLLQQGGPEGAQSVGREEDELQKKKVMPRDRFMN